MGHRHHQPSMPSRASAVCWPVRCRRRSQRRHSNQNSVSNGTCARTFGRQQRRRVGAPPRAPELGTDSPHRRQRQHGHRHQPPAASRQPPAASRQPPATVHRSLAASHRPPATSHQHQQRTRGNTNTEARPRSARDSALGEWMDSDARPSRGAGAGARAGGHGELRAGPLPLCPHRSHLSQELKTVASICSQRAWMRGCGGAGVVDIIVVGATWHADLPDDPTRIRVC